jgi:hypothetical protein
MKLRSAPAAPSPRYRREHGLGTNLGRPRHHSVSAGCQSSMRFPSGSVIQPNFPKS